jgi:hypothetical protein
MPPAKQLPDILTWPLRLLLSAIQILHLISGWFPTRKRQPTFAGAIATVQFWFGFRLGWTGKHNMINDANPNEPPHDIDFSDAQTVEFRCPDGSADVYLTLAGLTVAARHGLEMANALKYASETYVDVNIFAEEHKAKVEKT